MFVSASKRSVNKTKYQQFYKSELEILGNRENVASSAFTRLQAIIIGAD